MILAFRYQVFVARAFVVILQESFSGPRIDPRVTHLHEDRPGAPVWCGLYACSPRGEGLEAAFSFLALERFGG